MSVSNFVLNITRHVVSNFKGTNSIKNLPILLLLPERDFIFLWSSMRTFAHTEM